MMAWRDVHNFPLKGGGALKQRTQVPCPEEGEIRGGGNRMESYDALEISTKLIQFLDRSSSQKSRKLTSGRSESIFFLRASSESNEDDFFERGKISSRKSSDGVCGTRDSSDAAKISSKLTESPMLMSSS